MTDAQREKVKFYREHGWRVLWSGLDEIAVQMEQKRDVRRHYNQPPLIKYFTFYILPDGSTTTEWPYGD